ncbi:MAG: hypothetical protein WCR13_02795 [Sphaerochaeta sp.]
MALVLYSDGVCFFNQWIPEKRMDRLCLQSQKPLGFSRFDNLLAFKVNNRLELSTLECYYGFIIFLAVGGVL